MKILIVEDDPFAAEIAKDSLSAENHTIETATDGAEGSFLAKNYDYDAIILDYSLPKKDGLSVCKEIRAHGRSTPVIFVSATEDLETKIAALTAGADDYLVKPYSHRELHARLLALYRRPKIVERSVLKIGDIVLDASKHLVTRNKKDIKLTRKEFNVLEYLINHQGIIVSRALLMEHVWTADSDPFSNTVEAHMRNLRMKINKGGKKDLIKTVPGRGYMIDP
ncbi:MAG: response regulator transcription factor [bacterium]|nr:response regulator transcription factor [bacterium]